MEKKLVLLLLAYLIFSTQFCLSQNNSSTCTTIVLNENNVQLQANIDGLPKKMDINFSHSSKIYADKVDNSSKIKKTIKCDLFGDYNFAFTTSQNPNKCRQETFGAIGSNILQSNAEVYFLNFDEMLLCSLSSSDYQGAAIYKDFKELKSVFYRDRIEIVVSINWQDYKFIFDLGYEGTFSHVSTTRLISSRDHFVLYRTISGEQSNQSHEIRIFPFAKFYINKVGYSAALTLDDDAENRVGLGFIKGFNWIIDYKKKKIYYKKNQNPIDSNIVDSDYKSKIEGGKILIYQVKHKCNKYKVGDVVSTVCGTEINSENICQMQNKLKENYNWNDLLLSIK